MAPRCQTRTEPRGLQWFATGAGALQAPETGAKNPDTHTKQMRYNCCFFVEKWMRLYLFIYSFLDFCLAGVSWGFLYLLAYFGRRDGEKAFRCFHLFTESVAVFGPATRVLQAIALFLERQSDVQYADELLNMLDQHATPIDIYVQAGGGSVVQLKYWSIAYIHYSPQKLLYRPEGIQKWRCMTSSSNQDVNGGSPRCCGSIDG